MKRTTKRTMKRSNECSKLLVGMALVLMLIPGVAYASTGDLQTASVPQISTSASASEHDNNTTSSSHSDSQIIARVQSYMSEHVVAINESVNAAVQQETAEKILSYNPDHIAAIGTQESTGHSICCPSFSCAYADAVLDGTVNDHSFYTCSSCSWTNWGGGNSSFRCVGTDSELLREAYDEIAAGKPTVIHVAASYGEHWIALIGYTNVTDPNNLTLDNFIALDPWDGAQIIASERFSLYGDGCEHITERA